MPRYSAAKLLNHRGGGTTFSFFPLEGTNTHLVSHHLASVSRGVVPPLKTAALCRLLSPQTAPSLRNNENVIFRDAYYCHWQDTVSGRTLSHLVPRRSRCLANAAALPPLSRDGFVRGAAASSVRYEKLFRGGRLLGLKALRMPRRRNWNGIRTRSAGVDLMHHSLCRETRGMVELAGEVGRQCWMTSPDPSVAERAGSASNSQVHRLDPRLVNLVTERTFRHWCSTVPCSLPVDVP